MRARGKLRSRAGFTLTEMLMAMVVLGLVTLAVATGITAGTRAYGASVDLSHSQVLLSTLTQSVSDELRYARDINASGAGVVYTSPGYGPGALLTAEDGRVVVIRGGVASQLLGSGSYGGYLAGISVQYESADGCFQVELTVSRPEGGALQAQSFSVRALNPAP